MSRTKAATPENATGDLKAIYGDLQKNMGRVLNIFQHMGNSPIVLQAYLTLSQALSKTSLSPKLREQIALIVGQENQCGYCLSAHTALAKVVGLSSEEIDEARQGHSKEPKNQEILHFVKRVVDTRGHVSDEDVAGLKKAGVTDSELVEIILAIQVNMFTNYFNHINDTTIDFPLAPNLPVSKH
jgi:uncharacterized peroxidase-related enzyme